MVKIMPAQAHSQRQRSSLVPRAKSRCDSGFDFIDLFTQVLHSGKSRLDGTDNHSHAICVGHEFDLFCRDLKTSKSRIFVAAIIPSFLRIPSIATRLLTTQYQILFWQASRFRFKARYRAILENP